MLDIIDDCHSDKAETKMCKQFNSMPGQTKSIKIKSQKLEKNQHCAILVDATK